MQPIYANDWLNVLSKHHYEGGRHSYSEGPVFVAMENMYEYLHSGAGLQDVISAGSDYGLALQDSNPVSRDMAKWLNFIDWSQHPGYEDATIPARCRKEKCKITDSHSIKCYSFTDSTFSIVPFLATNRWFVTNCNVPNIPNVHHVPFGVPDWYKITPFTPTDDEFDSRRIDFFACWSNNTVERKQLSGILKNFDSVHFYEPNLSHEEFQDMLLCSKVVLCPEGNGYDSYRILEALYAGATPWIIVNDLDNCYWTKAYPGVPVYSIKQVLSLLQEPAKRIQVDMTPFDMEYWQNLVNTTV